MTTESPVRKSRPQSWLLIALGAVVVALIFTRMWSDGAAVSPSPAAPPRDPKNAQADAIDPKELKVRLDDLKGEMPAEGETERNPFRFQPKAPPAPPPAPPRTENTEPVGPIGPAPPPPPPTALPFLIVLMGLVDLTGGGKFVALSVCKGATFSAAEAYAVDSQYRIVNIGIESVTIEFINGKGCQTLRVESCQPRDR